MLLLTASEAGPAKAAELDGELLAIFARWLPHDEERKCVEELDGDDPSWEARFEAYAGPWHNLMHKMLAMPARTPEGIHAKACVLRALLQNHIGFDDEPKPAASSTEEMAWSLVSDMLGRVGA